MIAAVVVGCVAMLGVVWAQRNLGATLGGGAPTVTPAVDPRAAGFLAAGDEALAAGDLELAKESFDKASALAEGQPEVLLGLARLAAVRADVAWLEVRLLADDAADERRMAADTLADLAAKARRAADDALAATPDDAAALRAKIDALRISDDREGGRALVTKIAPSASQPESAYVLAALDLAEPEPLWSTILDRLKTASGAESGPGRARAALIYALARSGDNASAAVELDRLSATRRAHPLLGPLRRFVERAALAGDAGAPDVDPPDAGAPAAAPPKPAQAGGKADGKADGVMPTDPRELVKRGERARARGEYDRARTFYSAALEKRPTDSEALAGIAAISYAQRDLPAARSAYKHVLAVNPNYMPALVGLADVEWDAGDRAGAIKMYKDIADRYPEGAYPARVKQRIEGGG